MNFLHYQIKADPSKIVNVTISGEATVKLMDPLNFSKYKLGKEHSFQGGVYPPSSIEFRVTHRDDWHVVVDLGGRKGEVKASVKLIDC
jgi:hypothetical protein